MTDSTIIFKTRDELLRLSCNEIVCFKADDNTTIIVLLNGSKYTVCMSLSAIGEMLGKMLGASASRFARVGKSHIINLALVQHISVPRQRVVLGDGSHSPSFAINVSRESVRALKRLFAHE